MLGQPLPRLPRRLWHSTRLIVRIDVARDSSVCEIGRLTSAQICSGYPRADRALR
jgi:hypothetical protein